MTRRLWLALLTAHLLGLAAIFGGDALLNAPPPPRVAAGSAADPFVLARDVGAPGGRHVQVLIRFRRAGPGFGGVTVWHRLDEVT
jgi:hypothetical protein